MAPPTTTESGASRAARPGGPTGAAVWRRRASVAGAGLLLLAVSWLLLGDRDVVPGWEADVFEAVNGLPDVLRWPLWPIRYLGTFWMYVVGGVGIYALTNRVRPALATASAVMLAWVTARVIKDAVERGRPVDLLDGVTLRETNPDGYGYVSGHASVAFALATALTVVLPGRWRWVPLPVAALVGFARVFYGVHLPLDVVGGAGVGLACGTVVVVAFGADVPSRPDAVAATSRREPTDPPADS